MTYSILLELVPDDDDPDHVPITWVIDNTEDYDEAMATAQEIAEDIHEHTGNWPSRLDQ